MHASLFPKLPELAIAVSGCVLFGLIVTVCVYLNKEHR